ncbi:MAG: GAF domain-containing protein, partial [Desulfuromonadales bacterium]|nr:GAF domain-containing protein [Desulfuromonadales bacterium]
GLGQSVPNALLIVPLKVNDEIFGVVELAGFNEFEDHVIKFVEEVGESIASTISTTKINIRIPA